jgi:uroporphyrinogen decarboxylase
MLKVDCVKKALRHEQDSHVPYAINLTGQGYDIYGDRLLETYASEQIMQDYRAGIFSKAQAVSLAIGNHMLYVYAPWWSWSQLPPCFAEPDTPDVLPDTIGTGSYEAFFNQVKYIKEHYDVYVLVAVWGSHWEKAYFSRGIENFLFDLGGSPEWAQAVLDLIIRKNLVMLENILTCPHLDGILLGSDWGTQNSLIFSPECFRQMIKPGEKQEYDLIKKYGKDVFVHSCGNVTAIMEDLVELGVDGLNPVQPECMDLAYLKENFGKSLAFFGGISTQRTLPYGTPADVAAETEAVIRLMSQDSGYITSPSQEIQDDVPYENLIALIETAKKWS